MLRRHCGRQSEPTAIDEVSARVGERERLRAISAEVGFARDKLDISASDVQGGLSCGCESSVGCRPQPEPVSHADPGVLHVLKRR